MTDHRLVDESIFAADTQPVPGATARLAAASCAACATTVFPHQGACPRCSATDMRPVDLPAEGTLWGFTVQGFEPKPPFRPDGEFAPYGVGYVDLGAVLVESRLTENDPARLHTGMRVGAVLVPAFTDADGTRVLTYAFTGVDVPEGVNA